MKEKAEKTSKVQALEMQIKLLKEALDDKDKTISRLEIENADLRAQLARRYRRTSEAIYRVTHYLSLVFAQCFIVSEGVRFAY